MRKYWKHCSMGIALTLLLSLVPAGEAHSQVLIGILFGDKVSSENFHLGLNVGINFANLSGIDDSKSKTGLNLGLLAEWRFADRWYLQPELLPFFAVGANNLPPGTLGDPDLDAMVNDKTRSRRGNYFVIPVVVKYGALEDRLHIGAGGQVGFLTSAYDLYEGVAGNEISIKEDIEGNLASTDAGVLFHLEYKMAQEYGTGINLRYYMGLTDTIHDNPGESVYNRVFSLFVSVPMGNAPDKADE
jgi:hypothetical protein